MNTEIHTDNHINIAYVIKLFSIIHKFVTYAYFCYIKTRFGSMGIQLLHKRKRKMSLNYYNIYYIHLMK